MVSGPGKDDSVAKFRSGRLFFKSHHSGYQWGMSGFLYSNGGAYRNAVCLRSMVKGCAGPLEDSKAASSLFPSVIGAAQEVLPDGT